MADGARVFGFLTAFLAVVTLPAGILAFIFSSPTVAAVVFVVGWLLLTPATALLAGYLEDREDDTDAAAADEGTPLEALRPRYAEGEIDEAEFERRLDRLLDTEDVDPPADGREAPADRERLREGP